MKKLLLGFAAATLAGSAAVAFELPKPELRGQAQQWFNFQAVPEGMQVRQAPGSRADEEPSTTSLDFTMSYGVAGAQAFQQLPSGSVVYQAIEITPAMATMYAGNQITSINVTSGINSRTNKNNITKVNVFIMNDVDKQPEKIRWQAGTLGTNPYTEYKITLDEPYTIEEGKNFIIGYACQPTSSYDYYLTIDDSYHSNSEGCWVGTGYTNGSISWQNPASQIGFLCIGFTMEGNQFPTSCVDVMSVDMPWYVEPGKEFATEAYVIGRGADVAKSMDFTVKISDQAAKTISVDLGEGLGFNQIAKVNINGLTNETIGLDLPYTLEATKVDGNDNSGQSKTAEGYFNSYEHAAGFERTVVIEEGTGTWCPWCPAGYVLLENLKEKYNDGTMPLLALHFDDEMTVNSTSSMASYFPGFPMVLVNRANSLYPTEPSSQETIESYYEYVRSFPIYGDVDLELGEISGDQLALKATSHFALDLTNNRRYRLLFYVSEDGIGPYAQKNNYAGGSNGEMGGFENKPSLVNLMFDDVVCELVGTANGNVRSFPSELKKGEAYEYSATASLANVKGEEFYVTAILFDGTNKEILNAKMVKGTKTAGSGLESVSTDSEVSVRGGVGEISFAGEYASARVYNVAGQLVAETAGESRVAVPSGLYIVKADGVSAKVAVK